LFTSDALNPPLQNEIKMKFGASSSSTQDPSLSSSLYSATNRKFKFIFWFNLG